MNIISELLQGAYDCHMHAAPTIPQRRMTLMEVAQQAAEVGMGGICVKEHNFHTAQMAALTHEVFPEVDVRGGITLGIAVGGINPTAVETCFKLGGKVVYMFCLESEWMYHKMKAPGFTGLETYKRLGVNPDLDGYCVFADRNVRDELGEQTKQIIALCKQYNCVFETSHLAPDEAFACLEEADKQGFDRVVITHANQNVTPYSLEDQKKLVEMGATIMYSLPQYFSRAGETPEDIGGLGKLIKEIGAKNVVIGTDFGHHLYPPVVEGVRMTIVHLLDQGIPAEDIEMMFKVNPSRLYFD